MLQEFAGKPLRTFVVWEPVLDTDWGPPSSNTLARISDVRSSQFWDKERLLSKSMGEHDRKSVVWDHVEVFSPGAIWNEHPPVPSYKGGPVYKVEAPLRAALVQAFEGSGFLTTSRGHP